MTAITDQTVKKLFGFSNNRCAFPKCIQEIVDSKTEKVIGEICHIKARNINGPRYDPTQNDNERNSFDNLILLCPTHHTIIDSDIEAYTVTRLLNMKKEHEKLTINELDCPEMVVKQFVSTFMQIPFANDNYFTPSNPVGGQYAQSIQNFNGIISLDKDYSWADILTEIYSAKALLSELLAKTLNLANKKQDIELAKLCINELSGWDDPDPIKAHYRKKEIYVSLNVVKTAFNFNSNDDLWREFEKYPDDFFKNEFFFNEGVPTLEQALELNKSVDPNKSFIHIQEKQGNLMPDTSYPEMIVHIYCKGDTYHHLLNGIKNNLASELLKRIK